MSRGSCTNPRENFRLRQEEFRKTQECVICGRRASQNKLTVEDKRNNLTERDIQLGYCSECGEKVCGFCEALQVCH